jgi:hypothetical protein
MTERERERGREREGGGKRGIQALFAVLVRVYSHFLFTGSHGICIM